MATQKEIVEKNLAKMTTNQKLLASSTLISIMTPKKEIFQVKDSDILLKAFHKLKAHSLLSLPVYTAEKHRFFGFLDVADMLSLVLKVTSNYHGQQANWSEFLEGEDTFNSATCGSIANLSHHNPYTQVDPKASISTAISIMTSFSNIHRFAVVGPYPNYELLGIVSQTDVLRWIDNFLEKTDPLFSKSLKELKVGTKDVKAVQETELVSTALEMLRAHNISAIAVVNEKGKLTGNLSMSEVRTLSNFNVETLVAFAGRFCGEVVKDVKATTEGTYPVVVRPETTLDDAIKTIIKAKVHRAYLVDKDDNLIGLVSISDILKLFTADFHRSPY